MITKELIWQSEWVPFSDLTMSQHIANRAAAHGAAERERELMAVGMEPVVRVTPSMLGVFPVWFDGDWHKAVYKHGGEYGTGIPLHPAEQLAAARLQGEQKLRWLYSHCKAIGMVKKSDSGELEHDIALFTVDLQEAEKVARLQGTEDERKKHQCGGIPRKGCNYLTACGHVCNKCGEVHHLHQLQTVFAAPQTSAVNQGLLDVVRSALQPLNNGFVISPASSVHKELIAIAAAQEGK